MNELILNHIKEFESLIEEAKNIKEENNEEIRIATNTNFDTLYFYFNPKTFEIKQGAMTLGCNSQIFFKENIGNIEIEIVEDGGEEFIKISRIIRSIDEVMEYANDFEKKKFNNPVDEKFLEKIYNKRRKLKSKSKIIAECVNCNRNYIVKQKEVEDGLYTELNEEESLVICSKCTDSDLTIKQWLDTLNEGELKQGHSNYLYEYIGLEENEYLFL